MSAQIQRGNLIGIGSLLLGIFVFSIQDTIIKHVSGSYSVSLAIFLRSLVSFPILLAMVHFEVGLSAIKSGHLTLLLTRGWILLAAYLSYYMAMPALPLAEAIALFFMAPLFVTILSGPMLGERVALAAWAAAVIGLLGVVVIVRPGSALFEPAALLSLASAAAYAFAMVLARKKAADVPTSVMSFYQNVSYIIVSPFIGLAATTGMLGKPEHPSLAFLARAWTMPHAYDLMLMGSCGVIAAIAATLLTHAYRSGQAAVVTPFEYTGMIWGTVWGLLLFGEIPDPIKMGGMALIALSGILALRAGRRKD